MIGHYVIHLTISVFAFVFLMLLKSQTVLSFVGGVSDSGRSDDESRKSESDDKDELEEEDTSSDGM